MDGAKRTPWKFIAASVGLHLLIGGLLFCSLLKPRPSHPAVSVVQVSLVDPVENSPAAANIPQPLKRRLKLPTAPPDQPRSFKPTKPAVADGINKDNTQTRSETVYAPTVQTQQEEGQTTSTGLPSVKNSEFRNEQTVEDGLQSDELSRFLQDVRNRLEQAKRYPWLARIRGQEGTVRVQFMIDSAGEAQEIRLLESSRSKILDEEAVETVKRVGRFSHLPVSWNKKIQVQVPLVFQLNRP